MVGGLESSYTSDVSPFSKTMMNFYEALGVNPVDGATSSLFAPVRVNVKGLLGREPPQLSWQGGVAVGEETGKVFWETMMNF